jgi:hypothetical protein
MSDSDEVLPKKRAAPTPDQAAKRLKAQENDSDYEPTNEAGSEESDPDLYSDEYEHGDVEDFDTEAYLQYCQKLRPEGPSDNGVVEDEEEDAEEDVSEEEGSDEGEVQKPSTCSQDQESSSDA